jgi:DNA polymerase
MSDETRKEAALIARMARRFLERERAAGSGDLVARDAAGALGVPPSGARARDVPAPGEVTSAPGGVPASRVGPPVSGPTARHAPAVVLEAPPSARPSATDLFGNPTVAPRQVALEASAALATELPPHHEPLHPASAESRAELLTASLPILGQIASEVNACTRCGLHEGRTRAVPGTGSARSGIVFVGEAPGAEEDRQGLPFVGRAGELLTRMIKAMDDAKLIPGVPLDRETVYIANVLKCRPPENRNPLPHEVETCSPYLARQLEALKPRIICCLGKFAAELLVGAKGTIGGLRGKVYRYRGSKLIVTYHPAACLRNPGYKRPVWEDLQLLAKEYLSG